MIFSPKDSYSGIINMYSDIFVVYSKDVDIFPWYSISNILISEGNPVYSCDIQSVPIYLWHIQNMPAYLRYIQISSNMRLAILARLLPIYSWHIRITLNFKKLDRPIRPGIPTYCRYIQTCMIPPYVEKLVYWWHICRIVIVSLWLMGVHWIWI